jgi:hypothetical protein
VCNCGVVVKLWPLGLSCYRYHDTTSHADTALIELASKGSSDPSWEEADDNVTPFLGATGLGVIVAGLAARRASMSGGATVISSDSMVGNGRQHVYAAYRNSWL